ncbi:hypothetical protein MMPV_000097 [Pyropia vietnamensis]
MTPRMMLRVAAAAVAVVTLVASAGAFAGPSVALADTVEGTSSRTFYRRVKVKPTILQAVAGQPKEFSLLAAAVKAAGLAPVLGDPSASLTVFAPTDSAFMGLAKTLGWKGGSKASALTFILSQLKALNGGKDPTPLLASILKYHVTSGAVKAQALVKAGGYTPLEGPRVRLSADGKRLMDAAPAVADPALLRTDLVVRNGVVHVISGVLLPLAVQPKAPAKVTPMTIAQLASSTPSLSILVQALAAVDLVKVVADPKASLTVFAPTNAAFLSLAKVLGYKSNKMDGVFAFLVQELTRLGNGDPKPLLTSILTYHVLPTKKNSAALLGRGSQKTVQGGLLRVTRSGEVIDRALGQRNAKIQTADVKASNGVVHVVNRVLLPGPVCPTRLVQSCSKLRGFLNLKTCRCQLRTRYYKRN